MVLQFVRNEKKRTCHSIVGMNSFNQILKYGVLSDLFGRNDFLYAFTGTEIAIVMLWKCKIYAITIKYTNMFKLNAHNYKTCILHDNFSY